MIHQKLCMTLDLRFPCGRIQCESICFLIRMWLCQVVFPYVMTCPWDLTQVVNGCVPSFVSSWFTSDLFFLIWSSKRTIKLTLKWDPCSPVAYLWNEVISRFTWLTLLSVRTHFLIIARSDLCWCLPVLFIVALGILVGQLSESQPVDLVCMDGCGKDFSLASS